VARASPRRQARAVRAPAGDRRCHAGYFDQLRAPLVKGIEAIQKGRRRVCRICLADVVREMRGNGLTLREIAGKLASDGIRTARGGQWTAMAGKNVLDRAA
jgi:hypothetical protein